jgi:hypothetical protein
VASFPVSLETRLAIDEVLEEIRDGQVGADRRLENLIGELVGRQLSTRAVDYLEDLYERLPNPGLRALVARRAHTLRRDYLMSYKEFSDRALILLAEREGEIAQWEGIFLIGCFGGRSAQKYLEQRLADGLASPLREAAEVAIRKVVRRREVKRLERGF